MLIIVMKDFEFIDVTFLFFSLHVIASISIYYVMRAYTTSYLDLFYIVFRATNAMTIK